MHPMLSTAIQAARNASKITLRYIDQLGTLPLNENTRKDFVEQIDRMAEQDITQTIHKLFPQHQVITKASAEQFVTTHDYMWIIDPLSGKENYLRGLPHFSISIALIHKGKIEVGVVYDPIRQELFSAAKGEGSQLNQRKIRVSNCKKLEIALSALGFSFHCEEDLQRYQKISAILLPKVNDLRRLGDTALDLAYLAAGRLDAYWGKSQHMSDTAAGYLLVQEAGGIVSDLLGKDRYLEMGNFVASNAKLHQEFLLLIKDLCRQEDI